ncbi:ammonium transporter [Novosphingobium sp. BL-8H]|uniref:ammonium transporter n=1 Tax=Novosphingobium sp. BL-8H TaxID=3127640 RepID=UPI003757BCC0
MIKRTTLAVALPVAGLLDVAPCMAQATEPAHVADSGDTAWLLAAAALVLLAALPGIAIVYSARLRAGNALSVRFQALAIAAVVTLTWTIVGYTLAFGDVSGGWIGAGNAWMLIQLGVLRPGTAIPESAFVLFQLAVATLAPVLMTGAWAERARFGWVLLFCGLWSLMVGAPIAHWMWGGGWLASSVGTLDWSGGLAVFVAAGVSSLVVALMMGRRLVTPESRNRSPAALVGGALLWIGGLGLCGGWALAASDSAAAAAINAHVAMAAALLTGLGARRLIGNHGETTATPSTFILAGLAAIASGAGYVSPGAALVLGVLGSLIALQGLALLRRLRIDDALGVFASAGLSGAAGALLIGVFQSPELGGTGYAHGYTMVSQVFAQAVGLGVVSLWSAVVSAIAALMASVLFPMRMSENAERIGLDASTHGIHSAS